MRCKRSPAPYLCPAPPPQPRLGGGAYANTPAFRDVRVWPPPAVFSSLPARPLLLTGQPRSPLPLLPLPSVLVALTTGPPPSAPAPVSPGGRVLCAAGDDYLSTFSRFLPCLTHAPSLKSALGLSVRSCQPSGGFSLKSSLRPFAL